MIYWLTVSSKWVLKHKNIWKLKPGETSRRTSSVTENRKTLIIKNVHYWWKQLQNVLMVWDQTSRTDPVCGTLVKLVWQLLWCRKQFDYSKLYWSQPDEQENRFTVTSSKLPTDTKKCVCVCFFSPFNANQLHWNQHVIWINTHTRYLRSHDPTTRYVTSHRFTEVKCNKPEPDPDPDPVPGLSSLVLWGHCI